MGKNSSLCLCAPSNEVQVYFLTTNLHLEITNSLTDNHDPDMIKPVKRPNKDVLYAVSFTIIVY